MLGEIYMNKIFETNFKQWGKNLVRSHIFEIESKDKLYEYMGMQDEELLKICGLDFKTTDEWREISII